MKIFNFYLIQDIFKNTKFEIEHTPILVGVN